MALLLKELVGYRLLPWLAPRYQTERFKLSTGSAATEDYPMELMQGHFITSYGSDFPIPTERINGEWGSSQNSDVTTASAPKGIELQWFSYAEDKFYEGYFPLPQKRLYHLLKQGYWNTETKQQETYQGLIVCLLPKGVVVVWLAGDNQVVLGRYEAREIDFDFKHFDQRVNRASMIQQQQAKLPAHVQEEIRSGTLSTKRWDDYLKTYPWKVEFSQPLKLYDYGIFYLNAEQTQYPVNKDVALYTSTLLEAIPKPVPHDCILWVDAGYGRKRQIQVKPFDEAETLAAFQALHAANPTLPLTLYVETDTQVSKARLFLKNDRQQVELVKAKIELYDGE